jgi:hypothetical protein
MMTSTSKISSSPTFSLLLDLPPEIMLRIYDYLIVENGVYGRSIEGKRRIVKTDRWHTLSPHIHKTCRTCYAETRHLIYGRLSAFLEKETAEVFLPMIGTLNANYIRSISYCCRGAVDEELAMISHLLQSLASADSIAVYIFGQRYSDLKGRQVTEFRTGLEVVAWRFLPSSPRLTKLVMVPELHGGFPLVFYFLGRHEALDRLQVRVRHC